MPMALDKAAYILGHTKPGDLAGQADLLVGAAEELAGQLALTVTFSPLWLHMLLSAPDALAGGLLVCSVSRFTSSQTSDVLNIGTGSEDAQVIQIQAKLRYKENTKWFNQWYNIVNWRTMSKVMRLVLHTNTFIYSARQMGQGLLLFVCPVLRVF